MSFESLLQQNSGFLKRVVSQPPVTYQLIFRNADICIGNKGEVQSVRRAVKKTELSLWKLDRAILAFVSEMGTQLVKISVVLGAGGDIKAFPFPGKLQLHVGTSKCDMLGFGEIRCR